MMLPPVKLAPIHINFMLACHAGGILAHVWDSEASVQARQWLLEKGLIDTDSCSTERGKAWVGFICQTPLPEAKWVMPERAKGTE